MGQEGNTGYAYIVCKEPAITDFVRHSLAKDKFTSTEILWSIKKAPGHQEILWENMGGNYLAKRGRRLVLWALFMIFFFVFLTPATFSKFIYEIIGNLAHE